MATKDKKSAKTTAPAEKKNAGDKGANTVEEPIAAAREATDTPDAPEIEAAAAPVESAGDVQTALWDVLGVGNIWAQHGLGVARTALEATANTLARTAGAMGVLAGKLNDLHQRP